MIRLSNKLDYTKLESFKIKKILRSVNYELDLLIKIRIYLSFHISILKLINLDTLVQINPLNIDPSSQVPENKIKTILKKNIN